MNGVWEATEKTFKNSLKKSDARKDVSFAFQGHINEVATAAGKKGSKTDRPKSAIYYCDSPEKEARRRPASSEPFLGASDSFYESREPKNGKKVVQGRECCCCCCCREAGRECLSLLDFDSGCSSGFHEDSWNCYKYSHRPGRKCRSNPSFSKTGIRKCEKIFDGEKDLHKVKRSLRLLGFELSDFGICSHETDTSPGRKPRRRPPAFSTKITNRSISLDSLREALKKAWLADRWDEAHRRVLARAAYEEWYFRKERELWERREEERMSRMKAEENFRVDFQRKKEKSEEEFQKWLQRKRTKRKKMEENLLQKQEPFSRLRKSEEESEKAFIRWKKTKEKELTKRKIEKAVEEERKKEEERQKNEKKIIAEKAFQQWKTQLEESEKQQQAKRRQQKKKQELEERRRREEGSQISFEAWKAAKDEQIRQRMKQIRVAERMAREERLAQMEERMYEAEQAFEDWLERIDLRRQRQFCQVNGYQKNIPWIPA